MSLTDLLVRNSKPKDKQYKLGDSGGLYLLVTPSGGKYWRCKYRVSGKEKLLAIGVYPVITLAESQREMLASKKTIGS